MKRIAQKDNSRKKIKQIKSIEIHEHDGKTKQMIPDFSGKYYGKINDKISRKSAVNQA